MIHPPPSATAVLVRPRGVVAGRTLLTMVTLQATYGILLTVSLIMIIARFYLRIRIHQARRLLASDALMGAAWCAAFTTASFDVVFYKNNALNPELSYTLNNFDVARGNYEYVSKVRIHFRSIPHRAALYRLGAGSFAI